MLLTVAGIGILLFLLRSKIAKKGIHEESHIIFTLPARMWR